MQKKKLYYTIDNLPDQKQKGLDNYYYLVYKYYLGKTARRVQGLLLFRKFIVKSPLVFFI